MELLLVVVVTATIIIVRVDIPAVPEVLSVLSSSVPVGVALLISLVR